MESKFTVGQNLYAYHGNKLVNGTVVLVLNNKKKQPRVTIQTSRGILLNFKEDELFHTNS